MKPKKHWKKLNNAQINERIFSALSKNKNYRETVVLGIPGSYLDDKVFYDSATFLNDAPFLKTLIHNPNHIGCHTLGESESFFSGTQAIEKELISICAEDILGAGPDSCDGYVAAGGTEANLQAVWIYRNYFRNEFAAKAGEVALLCSEDTHYSAFKAADVFSVPIFPVSVEAMSRQISPDSVKNTIEKARKSGCKYFIVIANMMTTMFGSADNPDTYTDALEAENLPYKLHIDGAYGGFVYPFSALGHRLDFRNPKVDSFTMDAHKMVAAPYGTGIFICRKGLINNVFTKEAQYVQGLDATLSGSRSGANAVSIWMILSTYGPFGWAEKIDVLIRRAATLSKELDRMNFPHFRHPNSNIVVLRAENFPKEIAEKYHLVPDNHHKPNWFKIVVMDHVNLEVLTDFVGELEALKA